MVLAVTVADYTALTGLTVSEEDTARIQAALDTASTLVTLHLGDSADPVIAAYPAMLKDLVVSRVWRLRNLPTGIRSEAVGGASVTYDVAPSPYALSREETGLLDMLVRGGRLPGIKSVAVGWGGTSTAAEEV